MRRGSTVLVLAVVAGLLLCGTALAAFPGGNGRIAFVRRVGGHPHVMSVAAGGGSVRDLSGAASTWNDRNPQWSADGTRIVFDRCCPGGLTQVFVMNADGTDKGNVSRSAIDDTQPAFAPGGRITFARAGEIWIMNADGSAKHPVASADYYENPAWSPNGATIAFDWFDPNTGAGNLLLVPAAGGATTSIGTTGGELRPDWSPDGTRLVFETVAFFPPQIWVSSATGANAHRIRADAV